MTYVLSDLHGCYEAYRRMLEKIHFGPDDSLYVLGDIVDRGPDGMKLLLDLMGRPNVTVLRGNHDHTAWLMLRHVGMRVDSSFAEQMGEMCRLWMSDGGDVTWQGYKKLKREEKARVLHFLQSLPVYDEITLGNRRYFLAHTGPDPQKIQQLEDCTLMDFLLGEIDYNQPYFPDRYFVSGHTPTGLIDPAYTGRIYRKNGHIAVDCGAVFGEALGCLCLDTGEEFYVKTGKNG